MATPTWKHCGHPKTPENVLTVSNGKAGKKSTCRPCTRARQNEWERKRRRALGIPEQPRNAGISLTHWRCGHPKTPDNAPGRRHGCRICWNEKMRATTLITYHRKARTDDAYLIGRNARQRARRNGETYVPDNRPPGPGLIKALHTIDLR